MKLLDEKQGPARVISLRVNGDTFKALEKMAVRGGRTVSEIIRTAIEREIA